MLSETIGFAGPFRSMANAGDAFQILADFPKDPTYYTFQRGFSTLPKAIVHELTENHGDQVQIWLSSNVDSIAKCDSQFILTVTEAPEDKDSTPHFPGGTIKTVSAGKLIMAVASKGVEQLFHASPVFRDQPNAQQLWNSIHAALARLPQLGTRFG